MNGQRLYDDIDWVAIDLLPGQSVDLEIENGIVRKIAAEYNKQYMKIGDFRVLYTINKGTITTVECRSLRS